jgi:hypothetical protein
MEQGRQPQQAMKAKPQPTPGPIPRGPGAPAGATAKKRTGIAALAVAVLFVGAVGIGAVTTGLIHVPGLNTDTKTMSATSSTLSDSTQISDEGSHAIGVSALNMTPQLVKSRGLDTKQTGGYLLGTIVPRGPAEDAGLQVNDIIVAIDGVVVGENYTALPTKIRLTPIGEKMRLTIERDGAIREVPVQVARCTIPWEQRTGALGVCPSAAIVK